MTKKIDPRIAQRRQAVTRAAGRRRLRVLVAVLSVVAVIAVFVGVALSPLLEVKRVEVAGARHTPITSVLRASGLNTRGHAMVTLDRFAEARRVERLPWIGHATVTRKWPNTVRIRVTERVALGAIAAPKGVTLVDATGRVLATAATAPPGAIALTVPGAHLPAPGQTAGPAVRAALTILHAVSAKLAPQVQGVSAIAGSPVTYEVAVQGGVTLRLGDATDAAAKLAAAEAVLAVDHAAGTVIDVRVPQAPAVTHVSTTTKPAKP